MKRNEETRPVDETQTEVPQSSDAPATQISEDEVAEQRGIAALTEENTNLREQWMRLAAELDNYRKRRDREMNHLIHNANADLIVQLLPILDDLDRILAATGNAVDAEPLLEGIKLVQKNLLKVLYDEGLQPMQSVGQPFDPEKHDALLHVQGEEETENTVIDEHKKGYLFKDRVLRHAQVVVGKKIT